MKHSRAQTTACSICALAAWAFLAAACGDNRTVQASDVPDSGAESGLPWACDPSHNGWERCSEGQIEYCHVVEGMDPHFHGGLNCSDLGLTCTPLDDGAAVCVDPTTTCVASGARCEENSALFCAQGYLAREPCGTSKECVVSDGTPRCVDKATPGPSACEVFGGSAVSETAAAEFASFPDAHVEPGKLYHIELPPDVPGYVHFPVLASGTHELSFAAGGFFDAVLKRDGTEVVPAASGGEPSPSCANLIAAQWHVGLTYDGPGAGEPVPYVMRFKAVKGGGHVEIMVQDMGER